MNISEISICNIAYPTKGIPLK